MSHDLSPCFHWPGRGHVEYFLSKLEPKGRDCDSIRQRVATADTEMMKMERFCDFCLIFLRSVPKIFFICKIIKFKIIKELKKFHCRNATDQVIHKR